MDLQVVLMFVVNLVVVIGGLGKGIAVLIAVRDDIRDLKKAVGQKDPPDGLLGDVHGLQVESRKHRDRLIEIGTELGMKQTERS